MIDSKLSHLKPKIYGIGFTYYVLKQIIYLLHGNHTHNNYNIFFFFDSTIYSSNYYICI